VHRSRPKQKNSLHGRPHLHFIITFSGQNYLGPSLADLEDDILNISYDLTLKLIKPSLKDYLNAHKYLLKELKFNDIIPYLNQIHRHHLNIYLRCSDLIQYIENIGKAIFTEYGFKVMFHNK
jgi:hypothetical protein